MAPSQAAQASLEASFSGRRKEEKKKKRDDEEKRRSKNNIQKGKKRGFLWRIFAYAWYYRYRFIIQMPYLTYDTYSIYSLYNTQLHRELRYRTVSLSFSVCLYTCLYSLGKRRQRGERHRCRQTDRRMLPSITISSIVTITTITSILLCLPASVSHAQRESQR